MKDDNRLLVATYLTSEEKAWLKKEAREHSRSMAGQLRQMVIEKMREIGSGQVKAFDDLSKDD